MSKFLEKNIIEALSCCNLFRGKKRDEIETILTNFDFLLKEFSAREFIITIEESSPYIGIIISGCVEVQKPLTTGEIISISYKNKGELFGGSVAFSRKNSYPCDIYAKSAGRILFLHRQSLQKIIQQDPVISSNLCTMFAEGILKLEKRIELFSYSSIKQKIAFYLLDSSITIENNSTYLPFSKKTWADYLNVSRSSLFRELKELCNLAILSIDGRRIDIVDREELKALLF